MGTQRLKDIGFILIVFVISLFVYNGSHHWVKYPYGIHQWRQTMNFSMIQNYHEESVPFHRPAMNNLLNEDNTGTFIMEFPLLQWLTAFMPSDYFPYFRWLIFLTSLVGLYYGYKFAEFYLKDYFLSVGSMLMLILTPLMLYYNANYFTDIPAMSWGIAAVHFWHLGYTSETNARKNYLIGTLFFLFGGLIRLTCLIFPFAFLAFCALRSWRSHLFLWASVLIAGIFVIGWYAYQQNTNTYEMFLPPKTSLFLCDAQDLNRVLYSFRDMQLNQLGFIFRNVFAYVVLVFIVTYGWKQSPALLRQLFIGTWIGSIAYVILWFKVFDVHDYYLIPVLPAFFISMVWVIHYLKTWLTLRALRWLVGVLMFFSLYHGYENFRLRDFRPLKDACLHATRTEEGILLWFGFEDHIKWSKIRELSPYRTDTLQKLGIQRNDTAVCNFDISPTYVLSMLDLKGWTLFNNPLNRYEDYENYVKRGARYLIHYGNSPAIEDIAKDSLLRKDLVFEHDSIRFYRLTHIRR